MYLLLTLIYFQDSEFVSKGEIHILVIRRLNTRRFNILKSTLVRRKIQRLGRFMFKTV